MSRGGSCVGSTFAAERWWCCVKDPCYDCQLVEVIHVQYFVGAVCFVLAVSEAKTEDRSFGVTMYSMCLLNISHMPTEANLWRSEAVGTERTTTVT